MATNVRKVLLANVVAETLRGQNGTKLCFNIISTKPVNPWIVEATYIHDTNSQMCRALWDKFGVK